MKTGRLNLTADKVRAFAASDLYTVMLVFLSAVFIITRQEVLGTYILAIVCALLFFLNKDIIAPIHGILIISCFAIRCKNSMDEFLKFWPLGVIVIILFFGHFFRITPRFKRGKLFYALIAVSIAIFIGGVGIINPLTYFSPTSVFYMCSLGAGMLFFYCFFNANVVYDEYDAFENRFCKMMISIIPTLCISLIWEYASRFDEFMKTMSVIPFQWRNNAATLLMLAMPFAFWFSREKFRYFFLGVLDYAAIVFTGSRGGLIFGFVEFLICLAVMTVRDKKHRKYILISIGVLAAAAVAANRFIIEILNYTIHRLFDPDENSIRIDLIERGIKDFRASPVVGRGLAYMGNRDIHASAKHTLCWYHCSLVQVPASFGAVGIAAYTFLNIQRIRVYLADRSDFALTLFLSFIGLELMSLVNPGIFAPFPYLFLVTLYFSVMENYKVNGKGDGAQ
ncbi:MAG: O-antigen ligase family protein [Clostridia bacterium]|nr:O-antigen ligase family protein [Clostridia bacterium]